MNKRHAFTTIGLALFMSFWSTMVWAITPDWQQGDVWQVKVEYPIIGKTNVWTAPVTWRYEVVSKDASGITIDVSRVGGAETASLSFRAEGPSLSAVTYTKLFRGAQKEFTESFAQGVPAVPESFLAPCDMPVFPLAAPDSQNFTVSQNVAGLKSLSTISQVVSEAQSLPGDTALSGPYVAVRCSKDGTVLFEQYWQAGQPWPVYGENQNMRYWLVDHE